MGRKTKMIAVLLLAVVLVSAFSVAFAHTATTTANAWNSNRTCKGTVAKGPSCIGDAKCWATVSYTYFHGADPYGVYSRSGMQGYGKNYAESTSSISANYNYKSVSVKWSTDCSVGSQSGTRGGTVHR